jgi:hypothetical protein
MGIKDKLIKVYSGNEVTVNLLRGKLEIAGVSAIIRNDSYDSYLLVAPSTVDLYIQQSDYKKAEPIISEFIKKNKA